MAMTKEEILGTVGTFKHAIEVVPVPELGDGKQFLVRGLTAAEFDAVGRYQQELREGKAIGFGWRALTMAKSICDDNGKRIFTDMDANALSQLPSSVADRVVNVVDRLSASNKDEQESIAKN